MRATEKTTDYGDFSSASELCYVFASIHDVMTWSYFPHYWHFVRESTGRYIPIMKGQLRKPLIFRYALPEQTVE